MAKLVRMRRSLLAMAALALSISLQLVHPRTTPSIDLLDGVRGALLGIALGLLFVSKLAMRRR